MLHHTPPPPGGGGAGLSNHFNTFMFLLVIQNKYWHTKLAFFHAIVSWFWLAFRAAPIGGALTSHMINQKWMQGMLTFSASWSRTLLESWPSSLNVMLWPLPMGKWSGLQWLISTLGPDPIRPLRHSSGSWPPRCRWVFTVFPVQPLVVWPKLGEPLGTHLTKSARSAAQTTRNSHVASAQGWSTSPQWLSPLGESHVSVVVQPPNTIYVHFVSQKPWCQWWRSPFWKRGKFQSCDLVWASAMGGGK